MNMTWGLIALVGGFLWARYSPAAKTRVMLVAGTIFALVLIDVIGVMRIASGVPSGELYGLIAINVGYIAGIVLGAALRGRRSA